MRSVGLEPFRAERRKRFDWSNIRRGVDWTVDFCVGGEVTVGLTSEEDGPATMSGGWWRRRETDGEEESRSFR